MKIILELNLKKLKKNGIEHIELTNEINYKIAKKITKKIKEETNMVYIIGNIILKGEHIENCDQIIKGKEEIKEEIKCLIEYTIEDINKVKYKKRTLNIVMNGDAGSCEFNICNLKKKMWERIKKDKEIKEIIKNVIKYKKNNLDKKYFKKYKKNIKELID